MTESGMNIVHHGHPPAELDAPAWDADRLRAHLAEKHDMTARATDVRVLAPIHAAEHPVAAGIGHGQT